MEISTSKTVDNNLGYYNSRTYQGKAWTVEEYTHENEGIPGRQYGVRDWSRRDLNFEVVRLNGKPTVQAVDHSKPPLHDRWQKRIDEGYKATVTTKDGKQHKKPIKKSEIKMVMFDFGGGRSRMHELAFDRKVNLGKNGIGTNGEVQRKADIEQWAVDCYEWAAKKYGAENIIDFVVHLDETNPHIHCIVVPLTRDGKLSYTELFGGSREQAKKRSEQNGHTPNFKKGISDHMLALHTDFADSVGQKWGLDRGDDIKITGAVHKSTAESLKEKNALEEELAKLDEQEAQKKSSVLSLTNRQTELESRVEELEDASRRAEENLGIKNRSLAKIGVKIVRPTTELEDENERLAKEKEEALKIAREQKEKATAATKRADTAFDSGMEYGKQLMEQEVTEKVEEARRDERQSVAAEIRKLANFKAVDSDSPELIAQRWRKNYDGRLEAEKEVQNLKGNVGILEKAIQDILAGLMGFPIIRLAVNALRYVFANPDVTKSGTILGDSRVTKVNNALSLAENASDRKLLGKAIVELAAADFNTTDYVRGKVDAEVQRVADGTHPNLSQEEQQQVKIKL